MADKVSGFNTINRPFGSSEPSPGKRELVSLLFTPNKRSAPSRPLKGRCEALQPWELRFNEAYWAFKDGKDEKLGEALAQFEKLAKESAPRREEALFYLGRCQMQLGKFHEALKSFKEGFNLGYVPSQTLYGLFKIQGKGCKERNEKLGIRLVKGAIKKDPKLAAYYCKQYSQHLYDHAVTVKEILPLKLAANLFHPQACLTLAQLVLVENRTDVLKDKKEAFEYLCRARDLGAPGAEKLYQTYHPNATNAANLRMLAAASLFADPRLRDRDRMS
jgi:TPR repeat protein